MFDSIIDLHTKIGAIIGPWKWVIMGFSVILFILFIVLYIKTKGNGDDYD